MTASEHHQQARGLLARVETGLNTIRPVFDSYDRQRLVEMKKGGGDPVTEVDLAVDQALKEALLDVGEGWLSEETADSTDRLRRELVWIVDPLDGTREFIDGLPEFCTSIAAVVNGRPVAGGVYNPAAEITITGAVGVGVRCNGREATHLTVDDSERTRVLASRSEWNRGQWSVVEAEGYDVIPMGSVAYKMARVAGGLDHATWTPVPKHEWDVAGGAALLEAAGGTTLDVKGAPIQFNQPRPWLSGAIAAPPWFIPFVDRVQSLIRLQIPSD